MSQETIEIKIPKCWVVKSKDYHGFHEAKKFYAQAGIKTTFKERSELEGGLYVADFKLV